MSLRALLDKAYPALAQVLGQGVAAANSETPKCVVFFSIGNPSMRAHVHIAARLSLDETWEIGAQQLAQLAAG